MSYCESCDPKFFVVYGFCDNCNRRCEPPLFDPKGSMSLLDYDEFRTNWNMKRSEGFGCAPVKDAYWKFDGER